MIGHIPNLCHPDNKDRFTCAGAKVVYNGQLSIILLVFSETHAAAGIIWGTIGPQRMFQVGQIYHGLVYFFIIGPVVTVIVWLLYRRYPNSLLRFVNVPIFFNAAGNIPPANTSKSAAQGVYCNCILNAPAQYSLWFIFGFLFNYLIRKRAFAWWKRYNCKGDFPP